MKQEFYNLQINTNGQKLYEFTNDTIRWISQNNFKNGILNLSIQHTSASLIMQENADLDVQTDLINYFDKLAPMDTSLYIHTTEGTILKANLVHNYSDNGKLNLAVGGNTFNKMYQNVYVKSTPAAVDGTANALVQLEGYRDTTARENSFINLTNVNTFDRGTLTVGLDFTSTDNENERYHSHFNNEAADGLGAGGANLGASGIRNNFLNPNKHYVNR